MTSRLLLSYATKEGMVLWYSTSTFFFRTEVNQKIRDIDPSLVGHLVLFAADTLRNGDWCWTDAGVDLFPLLIFSHVSSTTSRREGKRIAQLYTLARREGYGLEGSAEGKVGGSSI